MRCLLVIIAFYVCPLYGQTTKEFEGIKMTVLNDGVSTIYSGTSLFVLTEITNVADSALLVHTPKQLVNHEVYLRDVRSHERLNLSKPLLSHDPIEVERLRLANTPASVPWSSHKSYLHLDNVSGFGVNFSVIPPGDYEVVSCFYIYPDPQGQKLEVSFPLKVLQPKGAIQDQFESFKTGLGYAKESKSGHYAPPYHPSHPRSIESFISTYPNSVFVPWAYFYLFSEVYVGQKRTIQEGFKKKQVQEFYKHRTNFIQSGGALAYIYFVANVTNQLDKELRFQEYDFVLQELEHKPVQYSDYMIKWVGFEFEPNTLTNYAQRRLDSE